MGRGGDQMFNYDYYYSGNYMNLFNNFSSFIQTVIEGYPLNWQHADVRCITFHKPIDYRYREMQLMWVMATQHRYVRYSSLVRSLCNVKWKLTGTNLYNVKIKKKTLVQVWFRREKPLSLAPFSNLFLALFHWPEILFFLFRLFLRSAHNVSSISGNCNSWANPVLNIKPESAK